MRGAIFNIEELEVWERLTKIGWDESQRLTRDKTAKQVFYDFIFQTLKSYKPSPNGNGIKWSKEEKEAFSKLSLKEQRKMIARKSELKSVLFPYVNVDYEPYKYSERSRQSGKDSFDKATKLLESHKKQDFSNISKKTQEDILHFLRIAYKSGNLKAGVELAKLLFERASLSADKNALQEIYESASITKALMNERIPENAYMYYRLYKWSNDYGRLFHKDITQNELRLVRAEARDCYNYALETIVWEAIDEEAQREVWKKTLTAAELYLAAGIKYQSPLAFYLAAQNYAPSGRTNEWLSYYLIPYNASLRCSIALGHFEALETLIFNYEHGLRMMRQNPLQMKLLETYQAKRATSLINGLDPYFDEKFEPEFIIDLGCVSSHFYGGTVVYPGISRLIKGENYNQITIKDPRDKDSTLESIKEYYLRICEMIVSRMKRMTYEEPDSSPNHFSMDYFDYILCSRLQYGYPSARPYIFPKEVLDLEIDFSKGLEGYGKDPNERKDI